MIRFQQVSKVYRQHQPLLLRELVLNQRPSGAEFTALSNLTFEVRQGEALGVIGRNGAGKSTLLKLMAGTLDPDDGLVHVDGNVAALMDLGVGFQAELTGSENIRLYAAMLGFTRQEIREYRERIIEFSELGDFIDRPLKSYSSGMSVRLAFSIAIHVDPEILIIDEVLSVGDLRFQEKCVDRIVNFRLRGKTLVFVSHGLEQVRQLCDRAIWLEQGRILMDGPAGEVIDAYKAGRVPASKEKILL